MALQSINDFCLSSHVTICVFFIFSQIIPSLKLDVLRRKNQKTTAQPLLFSQRYFATWLLVCAHRNRPLSLASRWVIRRKKHSRVRFLPAIFTTFLSVTRRECRARYMYIRPGHKWKLRVWSPKNFPRKKRVREMQYLHILSTLSSKKFQRHLNFGLTLYYGCL